MYFSLDHYFKLIGHVWGLKTWPKRPLLLLRLILWTPIGYLLTALFFLLDYAFFPKLWSIDVKRPVFVIGHARSGTTLTHRLLAADEDRFSYYLLWETLFPSLTQRKIMSWIGWLDARCGSPILKRLQALDRKLFEPYAHIHEISFWFSEEDQFAMRGAFLSQQWFVEIPLMHKFNIAELDQKPERTRRRWMRHYKALVKRQLVHRGGDKIHLSKNPVMSGWVESIIETFPDARFVVAMRNPKQCIPSILKLLETSYLDRGWKKADYEEALRALMRQSFHIFHHPKRVLSERTDTHHFYVDYRELTSQPRITIQRLYAALDLDMSETYDAYLLTREKKERRYKSEFEYDLEDYDGVSEEEIELELADFYAEYKW
ncbi:MAG: sulfotransferase [Pseudomonadota bacterium]